MSGDRRQCDGVAELPGLNPSAAVATDRELAEGLSIFLNFRREVYRLVDASSLKLANEPSWGLLHTMYERALAHVEGCFVLFSNNYYSCAEALCRTAIELSINLFYCSLGDTEGRIASYFKNYISTERDQNCNWLAAVYASKSPSAAKGHHRESIAKKVEALRAYERTLVQFYDQISLDYGAMKASWPSLFDRYKLIGKEIDYRTIYSALCSQAHNDAC